MYLENTSIVDTITQTINTIFNNLFSSIDNNAYATLDDITFISKDILNDGFSNNLLGTSTSTGIIIIANALIVGLSIYYAIRYMSSIYVSSQVEKPYQFIFRLIIVTAFVNCSYFICEEFLNINFLISGSIRTVGENLLNTNISFEELIIKINSIVSRETTLNVFSFDGMIKSFTSFGLFNLLFSYSLRYIMIKVFAIITPFMVITLLNSSTSWIFKTWMKSVLSLLLVQSLISVILVIIFCTDFSDNNTFTKLIYIGSIYALIKANSYMRQILGGISTDVSSNISSLTKMIK